MKPAAILLLAVLIVPLYLFDFASSELAGVAMALDYVDSSPVGGQFPEWDGGDTGLRFADINSDGHVDFLSIGDHGSPYINTDQHGVMVYFGDGAGGWSIHMEGNFGYGGIAVGDVNNDGLLDVGYGMHHDYAGGDFGDQLIEVALGDGTGISWTPWDDGLATNGEDYGMFATDFADIDNDGDLDLASNSFGCCNGLHVYRNNGDGTWTQTWAMFGGNSQAHLCFGDVNGDGNADIAASFQHGTIFLGDGEGGFSAADDGLPAAGTSGFKGVSLGDVDADGCADLSFTRNGGVRVYLWRGDHWEQFSSGLPVSGGYDISLLSDMNVDGWMDVVALGPGIFTVWLGDGTGNWTDGGGFYNSPAVDTAALETGGDIDHNGYPDVVLVQEEGSWPNYQNYLYAFRETSAATERFVAVRFPRGNETFFIGSVQTIRWSAAQVGHDPATIDLDLSVTGPGGPWTPIAAGMPDGGHHQWIVSGPPSDRAHIRVTLRQGAEGVSAVSPAFSMLPSDPAVVADDARAGLVGSLPRLRVLPNPVRDRACFCIEARRDGLESAGGWELTLHDPSGRLVRQFHFPMTAPWLEWDRTDQQGRRLAAGFYLARLSSASGTRGARIQRLVLLE